MSKVMKMKVMKKKKKSEQKGSICRFFLCVCVYQY